MRDNWTPPTPEDVRALRERNRLTQAELAELCRVGLRAVERYESPAGTISHRSPSQATWELVLAKIGEEPLDTSIRKTIRQRTKEK